VSCSNIGCERGFNLKIHTAYIKSITARMSIFKSKTDNFSIDDAFAESSEDKIRLYSNTSETAPLTDTIYEEQEPPDFEGSSLALSPTHSPDSPFTDFRQEIEPPIIKTKSILKNPTLQALKAREDKDSTSQDSASLIQNQPGYYAGSEPLKFWWKHPKIKENWKTVSAAVVLVLLGIALIFTGIIIYCNPSWEFIEGYAFFIAGFICLAPGGYHLGYLYMAVKGKRGFDFHHLPMFN